LGGSRRVFGVFSGTEASRNIVVELQTRWICDWRLTGDSADSSSTGRVYPIRAVRGNIWLGILVALTVLDSFRLASKHPHGAN